MNNNYNNLFLNFHPPNNFVVGINLTLYAAYMIKMHYKNGSQDHLGWLHLIHIILNKSINTYLLSLIVLNLCLSTNITIYLD